MRKIKTDSLAKAMERLCRELRKELSSERHTDYRVAQETGVNQSVVTNFRNEKRGIGNETADILAEYFGYQITVNIEPKGRG